MTEAETLDRRSEAIVRANNSVVYRFQSRFYDKMGSVGELGVPLAFRIVPTKSDNLHNGSVRN